MSPDQKLQPCGAGQGLFPERNHYFTGKYMTARDFRDEQCYFLSHHRWHQWTLHGWGIVWGLEVHVTPHRNGGQCITICPGMAIDCRGRELVLPYAVQFSVDEVVKASDAADDLAKEVAKEQPFLIGLKYVAQPREMVPLLVCDDSDAAKEQTYNRVRECAKICAQKYSEECWTPPRPYYPARLPKWEEAGGPYKLEQHMDPDGSHCPLPGITLCPPCECESGFVPLAKMEWKTPPKPEDPYAPVDSDAAKVWVSSDLGRRFVHSPFYGEALTHIVGINWDHAGETPLQNLKKDYVPPAADSSDVQKKHHQSCDGDPGRVILTFDRALAIPHGCQEGHDDAISTYFSQLFALDYLIDFDVNDPPGEPLSPRYVRMSRCRKKLFCDFPVKRIERQLPVLIRLSLRCDLVVDERGRAVDGDHICGGLALAGPVPAPVDRQGSPCIPQDCSNLGRTGDGTEGGVFFSWTKLTR